MKIGHAVNEFLAVVLERVAAKILAKEELRGQQKVLADAQVLRIAARVIREYRDLNRKEK